MSPNTRSLGVGGDIDEGLLPRREAGETRLIVLRKHEVIKVNEIVYGRSRCIAVQMYSCCAHTLTFYRCRR